MTGTARLVTIPISHFCEKARWALDRAGILYTEERHLQIVHHWYAKRAGGGYTTPALALPDGRGIGGSHEIIEWVDSTLPEDERLYPRATAPRVRAVERWLDLTLGPDDRGWIYHQMLDKPDMIEQYGLVGVPDWERKMFRAVLPPFKRYLALRMRAQRTQPNLQSIGDVMDEIAARLEEGRPYLTGDRFTAADLAFASLAAPLIFPTGYGIQLPPPETVSAETAKTVREFREHPAGQFALRMYDEHRNEVVGGAVSRSGAGA